MRKSAKPVHRFMLHIPAELWEPLQALAASNRRSVTSQINALINRALVRNGVILEDNLESIKHVRQRS